MSKKAVVEKTKPVAATVKKVPAKTKPLASMVTDENDREPIKVYPSVTTLNEVYLHQPSRPFFESDRTT